MNEKCGIDFGTSNSAIGYFDEAQNVKLVNFDGKHYTPSSIFFDFDEAKAFFGAKAMERYIEGNEGRIIWSPKNALGTNLINESTAVQRKKYSFKDIIQFILANLKNKSESDSGFGKNQVVCGRPVFFNDNDNNLDRMAQAALEEMLKNVGFKDVEFEYEPIAAAIDYERQIAREEIVLIIDMGGGTSDFSVLNLGPDKIRKPSRKDDILSVGGIHIAGTDFDFNLSKVSVMPQLGMGGQYKSMEGKWIELPISIYHDLASWHKIHTIYTQQNISMVSGNIMRSNVQDELRRLLNILTHRHGHYLAKLVEKAKIDLTAADKTEIVANEIQPELLMDVTRDQFNLAISAQVERIGDTILSTIADSGLNPEDLDSVFMTGGSSMIPLVRNKISSIVPTAKIIEGDKFGSVAKGLTLLSQEKFK